MRRIALALLLSLNLTAALAQQMPRMDLTAGFYRIDAEVAYTDETRQIGLMRRTSMGPNQGMLFVFPFDFAHCMWMRNTLIPLSVAFMDETGTIINIEDMQPQTEDNHCAKKPARYALEMNKGWFASKGIKPGTKLGGIERAPAPR